MKKSFIALLTFLSIALGASAQLGEKFTFGLRAGLGLGGFASDASYKLIGGTKESNWDMSTKSKPTYNVGAIFDIPGYHRWGLSVQTGLWFTERHTEFKGVNTSQSSTWRSEDLKAMYLQLPVQIGYHYNFGVVNAQALFGPYVEYRVGNGTSKMETHKSKGEGDAFSDNERNLAWGLTMGLGAEFRKMYLGFKYDIGLTNYYDKSNEDRKGKDRINLHGSMFSIVLGYNF